MFKNVFQEMIAYLKHSIEDISEMKMERRHYILGQLLVYQSKKLYKLLIVEL